MNVRRCWEPEHPSRHLKRELKNWTETKHRKHWDIGTTNTALETGNIALSLNETILETRNTLKHFETHLFSSFLFFSSLSWWSLLLRLLLSLSSQGDPSRAETPLKRSLTSHSGLTASESCWKEGRSGHSTRLNFKGANFRTKMV